jgi:hypothetical protein
MGFPLLGLANLPLNASGTFTVPGILALRRREYIYLADRLLAVDARRQPKRKSRVNKVVQEGSHE